MAQGGIIVFEADNADFKAIDANLEQNRKRAAKACASCQKRKKRCSHTFTKSTDQQAEKETAEKILPQLIHKEPVKFVGDLNPESVLTDLTQRSKDSPRYNRIGVWVEQSRFEQEQYRQQQEKAIRDGSFADGDSSTRKLAAVQKYAKIERGRRTLTGHQKNYLQAVGALRVLPKSTQDALVTTYVACIDPLLPIIDCKRLLQEYADGEASVFLIQAICLVACKTQEAMPHLRLYEDGPITDPIPFARALHTGLDAAMKADLEADRFTKVQIMTLMSLHNDGPGGLEESSLHLTMAIHDAQTTGLHINTPGRSLNDQAAMLWWTLWTLDKFNACLGGRPLMIADRDIDIKRPLLEQNTRSQTMAIWLAMGDLLDQVIEFYRPNVDPETAGWESDFPTFEDLTKDCSLDLLEESHRNLLEVCYNIIGILACRAGGPSSRSYNRRINSADRIQQLTILGAKAHLPPLPLVPYAISLSLTVAYRGLRDSHCDPIKTQSDLAARCGILESLHKIWWTADAMAKLGRKALKNIQQPSKTDSTGKSTSKLSVGDQLEAEISVCKFGSFNGNSDQQDLSGTSNGSTRNNQSSRLVRTSSDESNGLQVLSQAAATMGAGDPNQDARKTNVPSINVARVNPSSNFRTTDMINTIHPNKRLRFNGGLSAMEFLSQNNQLSPNSNHLSIDTPTSKTQMSTLSSMSANSVQTPLGPPLDFSNTKLLQNHSGVFSMSPNLDPFGTTYNLQQGDNDTMNDLTAADLSAAIAATTMAPNMSTQAASAASMYNPRMSVPLHYNNNGPIDIDMYDYNNLDNLFDGFFDLSMPTIFQDPLFEGAAYDTYAFNFLNGQQSGAASGAGSIDMNYDPSSGSGKPQQRQNTTQNHRYSAGNMNTINEVNKVSPPGMGANHWCWDEEDY